MGIKQLVKAGDGMGNIAQRILARPRENALSVARSLGFPLIKGDGKNIDGILFSRFENKEGKVLFLGLNQQHTRWLIKYELDSPKNA